MAKRRSRARAKKHGRRKFRARTGFGATKPVTVAALAQQPVRVVNIIPESLSGESNQDSEPSLAVNPANPLQMAASAFTPALSGNAPIFVSVDGGNSWLLNAIVPSDRMTADITVSFVGKSTTLYAGIIPQPIIDNTPGLNILRTDNFLGPTKMKILVDRRGSGVDQPYIAATTIDTGQTSKDLVAVGQTTSTIPTGKRLCSTCPTMPARRIPVSRQFALTSVARRRAVRKSGRRYIPTAQSMAPSWLSSVGPILVISDGMWSLSETTISVRVKIRSPRCAIQATTPLAGAWRKAGSCHFSRWGILTRRRSDKKGSGATLQLHWTRGPDKARSYTWRGRIA